MEELSAAHVDSPFDFVFRESTKISSPLIDLSDARQEAGDLLRITLKAVALLEERAFAQ